MKDCGLLKFHVTYTGPSLKSHDAGKTKNGTGYNYYHDQLMQLKKKDVKEEEIKKHKVSSLGKIFMTSHWNDLCFPNCNG